MKELKKLLLLFTVVIFVTCFGCKKDDSEKENKEFNSDLVGTWVYKGSKVVAHFGQVTVNKTLKFSDQGKYAYKSEEHNVNKTYNKKHNEEGTTTLSNPEDKEIATYKKSFGDDINPTLKVTLNNGKSKSNGLIELSSNKKQLSYFWETSGGDKMKRVYEKK